LALKFSALWHRDSYPFNQKIRKKFSHNDDITKSKVFGLRFSMFSKKLCVSYFSTNLENTKKVNPIDPKGQDSFNITSSLYKRIISVLAI